MNVMENIIHVLYQRMVQGILTEIQMQQYSFISLIERCQCTMENNLLKALSNSIFQPVSSLIPGMAILYLLLDMLMGCVLLQHFGLNLWTEGGIFSFPFPPQISSVSLVTYLLIPPCPMVGTFRHKLLLNIIE